MQYKTPQSMAFGASVKVVPSLKVNVDLKWVNYAVWDSLNFKFNKSVDFLTIGSAIETLAGEDDSDPNALRMPRNYQDVWSYALGVEYQYNDRFVWRAGYEPRGNAIPDKSIDFLVPLGDADLYTIGFGCNLDRYSHFDAAFGYLRSGFDIASGVSKNANGTKAGDVVYNPYAYLDLKATTTALIFAISYDERF